MNKRKIGMVCPFPYPIERGSPIRARKMALSMSKKFEVHVITYHAGNGANEPYYINRTTNLPFTWRKAGASWKKLISDMFLVPKLRKILKEKSIDVLHCHLHESVVAAKLAGVGKNIPIIYDAHGTFAEEIIETTPLRKNSKLTIPLKNLLKKFETFVEKSADHIIAQSEVRAEKLKQKGIESNKITVVNDSAILSNFQDCEPDILRKEKNWNDEIIILYSGGLQDFQGIPELIKATSKVDCSKPVRLVLFSNQESKRYEDIAEKEGLKRLSIIKDEPRSELPSYLKASDILAVPRRYGENVPSKLLEYIAAGKPILGTKTEGVDGVIESEEHGLLVPPNSWRELKEALKTLCENPSLRSEMGEKVVELCNERFNWEDEMEKLVKVYEKFL